MEENTVETPENVVPFPVDNSHLENFLNTKLAGCTAIEAQMKKFAEEDLAQAKGQFAEAQRKLDEVTQLHAQHRQVVNNIEAAIQGGYIMIQRILQENGVSEGEYARLRIQQENAPINN